MNTFRSSDSWNDFIYYTSAETSRTFLLSKYEKNRIAHAKTKSFDNCYPFIYYLEQGKCFFDQLEKSPITIKPILLFYGFIFLIKACILTIDPDYPSTTSVLAHGVSTRKKKKTNYLYFADEVKIQKNGLFPHFSKTLFQQDQLEGKKITIKRLFLEIPEIAIYLNKWEKQEKMVTLLKMENKWEIPEQVLDLYKMTKERFYTYITEKTKGKTLLAIEKGNLYLYTDDQTPSDLIPFRYNYLKNSYHISLIKDEVSYFHELMVHYLILYHLSMIARYEIEWWSEVINQKHGVEYPIIVQYIKLIEGKIPFLISQLLFI